MVVFSWLFMVALWLFVAFLSTFGKSLECALRGRRSLRDLCTGFALGLPMVGGESLSRFSRRSWGVWGLVWAF
jgi:hypothetical protein